MHSDTSIINIAESEFSCVIDDAEFSVLFLTYPIDSDKQTEEGKPLHTHDYYETIYFMGGKAAFETESGSHELKKGNIVIESPLCRHKYSGIESSSAYKLGFNIRKVKRDGEIFEVFDAAFKNLEYEIFGGGEKISENFNILAYAKGECGEVFRMRAAFTGIIFFIYDKLRSRSFTLPITVNGKISQRNVKDVITNAILFHYTTDISVEDIAGQVYLSARQVNRICHGLYGRTFNEQKIFCRIEKAKRLLEKTKMTALEICYECGFTSLGSFYSAFEKYAGIPPKKYRDLF